MSSESNAKLIESPEVVVVQASAGSGKTYSLAKRFLQLLINPTLKPNQIPLRIILAITFTNKATVEMKERILEILKKIALDSFETEIEKKDILSLFNLSEKDIQSKARAILDEIIRHYNFFQVQTIDSFINSLLLGCALNIDRSASFKIKKDYSRHLGFCLDRVIDQAPREKEVFSFFEDFLEHYLFVEKRMGWLPKKDILELMQSLFRQSNKYGTSLSTFAATSIEVIKRKKYIFGLIEKIFQDIPQGFNASCKNSIQRFLQKQEPIFNIPELPSAFRSPEVPMNKNKAAPVKFVKSWKKIHKSLYELIEIDATVTYNPYVKLFNRLLDFFHLACRQEDILFLEELNRAARSLFDEQGLTVAELYYRLATRFRHFLIDEFQDTSSLQWKNLKVMVEEALSSGGTLFYVGDKKQAIYRFRGGQAKLFDEVKQGFLQFNVKESRLNKNWRSQKEIVEFNNKVFSQDNLKKALQSSGINEELNTEEGAAREILDVFKDSRQQYRKENEFGYVRVECIDEKNQQERDEIVRPKLIDLIKDLKKRCFDYKDIAILTRDNNEVELVTSWCLEQGFSVESEKTLNIAQNSLIKELISFLRFLDSPIDDLSFASFVLGDLFTKGVDLDKQEIRDFIFDLHKRGELGKTTPLYRLFRQEYPKAWDGYLGEFFKNVGFVSVYELVIGIYQRFDIMKNFREAQGFFMKFLELIKAKEDDYAGLVDFLNFLDNASPEELYVNISESDSIRILTIHKAKGLEFPVVIVPFLRIDINPETAGKGTNSYIIELEPNTIGLVRITKEHRAYSQRLQKIYAHSYKESCIDELNNIYVALTRPQFELYAFVPKKSSSSKNKVRFLLPEGITEAGKKKEYQIKKKDSHKLINIPESEYKSWTELLRQEFLEADQTKKHREILEGNILHTALSNIGDCTGKNIEELIKNSLSKVLVSYPFIKDISFYKKKLESLLSAKELREIFFNSGASVFCEKEVVNNFGDLKRIDRLIVSQKKVLIIDYKLSSGLKDKYKAQLKEYAEVIKDIYPNREIKGILLYLNNHEYEEIKT